MVTFEEIEQADVRQLPVSKRVEAFYKGTDAVEKFAGEVMIPVLRGQLNLNNQETAITGIYYRMYAWVRSLITMNDYVHFQGTAAAARTLFELLLDEKLLVGDSTGKMTEKFHAFTPVERFRAASKIVSYVNDHPTTSIANTQQRQLVNNTEKRREIEQLVKRHWGTTTKGKLRWPVNHWSGLNVEARAKHLGDRYEELYIESYPMLSWSVHAGSAVYTGLNEDALESMFGIAHRIAQMCFLEATKLTAEFMQINKAVEGFQDVLNDLQRVPGKVLVAEQIQIIDAARKTKPK